MAKIPKFKTEDEERDYWDQHSPLEHLDELAEQDVIQVKQRPPKIQISLRIRPELKDGIEKLATQKGIPYQTLINSWIMERYYAETGTVTPPISDPRIVAWVEQLVESRVAAAWKEVEQRQPGPKGRKAAGPGRNKPGQAPARPAGRSRTHR